MSSVVNAIQNIFATVVSILLLPTYVTIALLESAFGGSFETHLAKLLENTFGFFGLKGEDVISTQVQDTRLLSDDFENIMTKIALEHQDTQAGIIEIMQANIAQVRTRFNQYFDYGKSTYYNGLPASNLTVDVFPTSAVISSINSQYGVNCELSVNLIDTPTKDQWIAHKLKDMYGYNLTTNHMTYLTYDYMIDYSEYNFSTNLYDVHVYRPNYVTDTVTTTTTISVIPINSTTETKRTVIGIAISGNKSITGAYTSSSSTTTDVIVAAGSTTSSTTTVVTYPPVYIEKYTPSIISIASFLLAKYFIVAWNAIGSTDTNYWTYLCGSGNASLDQTLITTNLDMLPIVTLRNNSINTNSNKTSTTYLQSKEILSMLAIDIDTITTSIMDGGSSDSLQDSFIYFGLDVTDTHPTSAKYLFKVFDYVLTHNNDITIGTTYDTATSIANKYSIRVSEGVYNASLGWSYQTRNTITGTIGTIGTYSSEVSGADLILRGQLNENHYIEYRIVELSGTTIITRAGLHGAVTKTLLKGPVILPMCYNIVDQFSSMEQMVLYSKGLRLSNYAADITHLAYYQTAGFLTTIQITLIAVSIVLTIYGGPAGLTFYQIAMRLLILFVVSVVMRQIMISHLPTWLKVVLAVATIAAGAYGNNYVNTGHFLSASEVTNSVTNYVKNIDLKYAIIGAVNMTTMITDSETQRAMRELQKDRDAFQTAYDKRLHEIEQASNSRKDFIDTGFISGMAIQDVPPGYVEGADLNTYKAVGMQKDFVMLSVTNVYEHIYDYDRYFKVGLVSL